MSLWIGLSVIGVAFLLWVAWMALWVHGVALDVASAATHLRAEKERRDARKETPNA